MARRLGCRGRMTHTLCTRPFPHFSHTHSFCLLRLKSFARSVSLRFVQSTLPLVENTLSTVHLLGGEASPDQMQAAGTAAHRQQRPCPKHGLFRPVGVKGTDQSGQETEASKQGARSEAHQVSRDTNRHREFSTTLESPESTKH